jgi:hypothetical protein
MQMNPRASRCRAHAEAPDQFALEAYDAPFGQALKCDSDRRWVHVVKLVFEFDAGPAWLVVVAEQLQDNQALRSVLLQRVDALAAAN